MRRWTSGLVIVVLGVCVPGSAQNAEWRVTTDRLAYSIGEHVIFSMEACNNGSQTLTVDLNVAPTVIDAEGEGVFGFTLLPWAVFVDVPPGECRSATDQVWPQQGNLGPSVVDQVPPGWYRGDLDGVLCEPFEIQTPRVPVSARTAMFLVLALLAAGMVALRRSPA